MTEPEQSPANPPNPYKQFTPENLQYAKSFIHRLIIKCEGAEWVDRLFVHYGMISMEEDRRESNSPDHLN